MYWSRATLAIMEAALTSLTRLSAFLSRVTRSASGVSSRRLMVPSMIISVNGIFVRKTCLTARRAASFRAGLRP